MFYNFHSESFLYAHDLALEPSAVLAQYLEESAYRFQMRFDRGPLAEWHSRSPERAEILRERRRWIEKEPHKHVALLPEGLPLLQETWQIASAAGTVPEFAGPEPASAEELAFALGTHWEPDFLVLGPDAEVGMRLLAGVVCFPSSWALEEKIGLGIDAIHAVVPGLNAALGKQILAFLTRIKPGVSWNRTNWGLSRSPERNQHPFRNLPRLSPEVALEEVFFRVEEQSLYALPQTNGVLFGIRVRVFPLREVASEPEACSRLIQALQTMPEPLASYKGISAARGRILELLQLFRTGAHDDHGDGPGQNL